LGYFWASPAFCCKNNFFAILQFVYAILAALWYFAVMYNFLKGRLVVVRLCLLAAALALVAVGIAAIYSVGHPAEPSPASQTGHLDNLWKKQLVFAAIGVLVFIAVNLVNYRRFGAVSYWIYAAVLLLLGVLLLDRFVNIGIGSVLTIPMRHGTRRWIIFSIAGQSVSLQPSEICKLAYILALAWYLRYRSNYRKFTALVGPFALTLLPMVLILLEPDLGTVLLMMPVLFAMLFVAGAKVKHLLIIILMALLVSPLLWFKMEKYQRTRISSVLLQNSWIRQKAEQHPMLGKILVGSKFSTKQWKDDLGYHLIRSKFAVASGGAKGYGFRKGPFIKYNFLPTRHNDFIFAVIAHQWGFWGCLGMLGLYAIIIGCGLEIAGSNTDPFGRLLVVGIVAMFAVEVIVNVSMTVGLMPITGLTLPLVSYGGSSLLVSMAAVGLLNNVGRCRPFTVSRKA
jgi:cell division protein FtsW (lipid II flippase)